MSGTPSPVTSAMTADSLCPTVSRRRTVGPDDRGSHFRAAAGRNEVARGAPVDAGPN